MNLHLRRLEVILISLIGIHSLILGTAMLFQPTSTLQFFGWNYQGPMFFPSQTGIFLVLFGVLFIAIIKHRNLTWFIVVVKSFAVLFLLSQYLILGPSAPFTVLMAAVADGLMGVSVTILIISQVVINRQNLSCVNITGD